MKANKSVFERNPKKTIIILVVLFVVLADSVLGIIFIPKRHHSCRSPHYYYHHGLSPYRKEMERWGRKVYPMITNSLGFRDKIIREIALQTNKKRILFIGDSFTEGVGVTYEESFVGLIDKTVDSGIEILNAAVNMYSPKMYYLKTKFLIEYVGLKFDELFVFIDISDVQDEILFEKFKSDAVGTYDWLSFLSKRFLKRWSYIYYSINKTKRTSNEEVINPEGLFPSLARKNLDNDIFSSEFINGRPYWTLNDSVFNKWGRRGLILCRENIKQLADICRKNNIKMTIVVYPWKTQIYMNDLDSRQVAFWGQFCRERNLSFINLFPEFINEGDADIIVNKYFIKGDDHWNVTGHRLVANKILKYINLK